MKKVSLNANIRDISGKRVTQKLKKENAIPAVLYGDNGSANRLIKVDTKEISSLLHKNGENVIVELRLGDETIPAIIKEVQRDPINNTAIHIDFQPVTLHELIHAELPVIVVNGHIVEKNGWVINKQLTTIEVEGDVERIPQSIKLDASHLRIGDVVKVADLEVAGELSIISKLDDVILSIKAFKKEPINLEFERTEPELVKNEE